MSDSRPLRIFFSAGEPSGDLHGANLIREFRARRPDCQAMGYGGPEMAAAGCALHEDLTALAVMWFARVLINLHRFWALVSRADRFFRHHRPDAVVLIDYPGFNWWIARRAKAHRIPVFYYAPPQIWAWAQWRVKKMQRLVDHVLCALPFEAIWFEEHGCRATFVGHPFFDEVARQRLDQAFMAKMRSQPGPLLTILPGSRTQEVENNLQTMLRAAALVHRAVPDVRLAIAAFKPHQAELARAAVATAGLPVEVHLGRTPELIRLAHCCLAVSGSVSLELLAQAKPTVVLYRVSPLAFRVQSWFRKVKYITLVNLLSTDELFPVDCTPYDPAQADADEILFPEYLAWEDKSPQLAKHLVEWLTDETAYRRRVEKLTTLRAKVAHGGASKRAAEYILKILDLSRPAISSPHFLVAEGSQRGNAGVRGAADLGVGR